jgi:UDP-N-acetylmuramoylalanine--D-glutamate ligase
LEPGKDGMVLELSSYQLADLEFAPQMAVVTNLYPEHGPWHGGIEPYYRDKLRALTLSPDTVGVCNFASDELKSRIADRPNTHWFNGLGGFRAGHGELLYGETPVACTGYPLKGDHNLANLAAVATVADLLGLHGVRRHIDLGGFAQLPHRLEELPLPSGILAINDSISTVPEATIAALNAYPGRDVVLLLGGDDRGQAYDQLIEVLRSSSVHSIILLPKNGARILAEITAAKLPINTIMVANLTQGVGEALRAVRPNGAILLSPAAPSFGEFANFEERGNLFKTLCKQGSGL